MCTKPGAVLAQERPPDGTASAEEVRQLRTLVQELEDMYGVKISDEEAAKILTVGQAVDFVLASGVGARASHGPDS